MTGRKQPSSSQAAPARDRALAAAERLFARHGLNATTLRQVADASGVPINLISYHFKTKEDLLRAVLSGHSNHLTALRRTLLTDLELHHSPNAPPVHDIMATFYRPIFILRGNDAEHWANFVGLLSRERGSPAWQETIGESVAAMLKQYTVLLQRALPKVRRAEIVQVLSLSFLAIILSSPSEVKTILGDDLMQDWDDATLEAHLVKSLTAAVLSLG